MGKITWTEKASAHLQAIHDYIARDSQTYATNFVTSLVKATLKLEAMPLCGRIVPEFQSEKFREVIYKNYRIVYRLKKNTEDVDVLAVIHAARDMETAFRERWELSL